MQTKRPPLSLFLAQATQGLIEKAIEALEECGADIEADNTAHHTFVMQGGSLVEVLNALTEWTTASCAQGACDSWTHPQAQAAQNAYQIIESIFTQSQDYRDVAVEASVPMLVAGESLMALADARTQWAQAWKKPCRIGLR